MRLSEAIRLGAMLKKQCRERLHDSSGATCALGAALDAIGELGSIRFESGWDGFHSEWPVMVGKSPCPVCPFGRESLGGMIVHLNDDHRWTREQIADWVETVESARQQADASATTTNAPDPVDRVVTV